MEFYYHELDKDVLVLSADGGLNSSTAEQFITELERMADAGIRKMIVDCSKLQYVSSYGIAVLLRLHRRVASHGGDVRLAGVGGMLVRVLEVTRLNLVFSMYPDVNQARLSFRPPQ